MEAPKLVADIMTRDAITVYEEENLVQVIERLRDRAFHHLPVVDGTKLVGLLSQKDLFRVTVTGRDHSFLSRAREARFLEETFVRDIMQTKPLVVRPDETIQSLARRMLDQRAGCAPVVDGEGNLVGVVTENDLVKLVARMA